MSRGRTIAVLLGSLVLLALGASGVDAEPAAPRATVRVLKLTGVVDPFMASYLERGIAAAGREQDAAVLLMIDTPGGLDASMRGIVRAVVAARLPVLCYTAPSGARAASAGTFVMLACPVAAMAPGTTIGAAHPVGVSGAIEQAKVTNDAAAFIRSLAERSGRNPAWAEQAVRSSVSASATQAVQLGVVDLIAPSTAALLQQVDGRTVTVGDGPVTLHTAGAAVVSQGPGAGVAFLHALITPDLAFLFFYLGIVLLVVELLHPGISVAAVAGTLLLVLSIVSFGLLPVRLGGLILLVASAVFFLAELKHPGLWLPLVAGVLCLVFGGLLLFDPSVPNAQVSRWLLVLVPAGLAAFFLFVVQTVLAARHLPPAATGVERLVGEQGVAVDTLDPRGRVRVRHELWSAESAGAPIAAGTGIRVLGGTGVRLLVAPDPPRPPVEDAPGRPGAAREGDA